MQHAVEKLEVYGDQLPFPHSTRVRGAAQLRELRPRAAEARLTRLERERTCRGTDPST